MSNLKKLMQRAAAGAAGGAGLDVNEVFSTYLYDGTNATQTITNGIDLSGEGGLVWIKNRDYSPSNHLLFDTERGAAKVLYSNATDAEASTTTYALQSFTSTGFTLGPNGYQGNRASTSHASWTFRKAPKFFDVVTYTGAAFVDQTVSHNLGSVPGMIIIKCTSSARNWVVYHRSLGNTKHLHLNTTDAESTVNYFNNTDPTDTTFTVEGGDSDVNGYNETYVAYLFAHNDGDGDFGPTADQDIIKCGSFTTDGSGGVSVDLGFEPQWIMYKPTSTTGPWVIVDSMRGWTANSESRTLTAESSGAEQSVVNLSSSYPLNRRSDGFDTSNALYASQTYIYIAIRRGPMAVPESATDVFDVAFGSNTAEPWFKSGFVTDMGFLRNRSSTGNWAITSRLTQGTDLNITTSAESPNSSAMFDYQNGYYANYGASTSFLAWMWRRAPNYFDAVAYTGNGTSSNTVRTDAIPHNLGVQPEMVWVKRRDTTSEWVVAHKDYGSGYLNLANAFATYSSLSTTHNDNFTETNFKIGAWQQEANFNVSGATYIAYLFASLDGVSKVGSYTGNDNGSNSQVIDCGFASGARFVLIKLTSTSGYDWYVFDTERGIVAGDDPYLLLNTTGAEQTVWDGIDPNSSGFEVTGSTLNVSGATYIFYAIA